MINEDIKIAAYDYVERGWNIIPCGFKSKSPIITGWNTKEVFTTKADIDKWSNEHGDFNLGIPLGKGNSFVAIDVDGKKAMNELHKVSKGELPQTLEFTTPGGGYRYIYKLPEDIQTKPWRKTLAGNHEELSFMAQGQQTILPPSIHTNGGIYEWVDGKDPASIEIEEAPQWLLKLITKDEKQMSSNHGSGGIYSKGNIDNIYSQCKWFKHCKDDSRTLSQDEWFKSLTVINTTENSEENAIEYSRDYSTFSESETLEKLKYINDKNYRPVSCSNIRADFGCNCEGCTLGVGSPASLGRRKTREELEAVGFYFDNEGVLKGLNGNKFAAYLISRMEILLTDSKLFYIYLDNFWQYVDENSLSRICRDILHEFVPNYWNVNVEGGYIEALKREAIRVSKLDSDRTKINVINGVFDLKDYDFIEHSPLIRSSVQIPIQYNEEAKCPNFQKFLEDIFEGDRDRIKVIQEMYGYCLTAETTAQKAFILYGRGANGKSLLAEVLMNLVGKNNTSAVPLNDLDSPFARYGLVDKLLNLATENEISSSGLDTTFFKCIASGDSIEVEKKFEQGFMYQPFCKLVFCLNNLPYSKDKSWGYQRRLIVIPFTKVFYEDDPNTQNYGELRDKLLSELDGIFLWALNGLKRLRENKFKFSKSEVINEALEDYKTEVNAYYNYAKDALEQGDDNESITNDTLSNSFREWASKNGHKSLATASNQKIISEVRGVLLDMKTKINYGNKVKIGGKRCTEKIRFKRGEKVDVKKSA